jgi:excisionase family DNA binding protein
MSGEFEMFSVEQVAALTGMTEKWLWAAGNEGTIPYHRLGRYIRFTHDDMRALMAQTAVPVTVHDDELVSASRRGRPARY